MSNQTLNKQSKKKLTKKQRRALKITKFEWKELDELASSALKVVLEITGMQKLFKRGVHKHHEDPQLLMDEYGVLIKETKSKLAEVQELRARHKGKTGECADEEERLELLSIYSGYDIWVSDFMSGNAYSQQMYVMSLLAEAEENMEKAKSVKPVKVFGEM